MDQHNSQRDTWTWPHAATAVVLTLAAIALRVIPHPPNFHTLIGAGLYGAARLPKAAAIGVPLAAIIISDLMIGMHVTAAWTWGAFALIGLLGLTIRHVQSPGRIAATATASAVLFYLISNFGVWAVQDMYPKTASGLVTSYIVALPYLRNALLGTWLTTLTLFSLDALLRRRSSAPMPSPHQLAPEATTHPHA